MITPIQHRIMEFLGEDRHTADEIAQELQIELYDLKDVLQHMEYIDLVHAHTRLLGGRAVEYWKSWEIWREILDLDDVLEAWRALGATLPTDHNTTASPEWLEIHRVVRASLMHLTDSPEDQVLSSWAAHTLQGDGIRLDDLTLPLLVVRIYRSARQMRKIS